MVNEILKYIKKTLLLTVPVLVVLVTVNYIGDGARLFDDEYEANMAKILVNGSNVTNVTNFDERIFQKELIARVKKPIDVLVVGSSRTMLVNESQFEGKSFFNSSVTGASVEDLIGLCQLYKNEKRLPQKLILGIDPWIFNANNNQLRWSSLGQEVEQFVAEHLDSIELEIPTKNKYLELFSISYFQSSFLQLPKVFSGKNQPVATKGFLNVSNTKITDGSLKYGKGYREADSTSIAKKVKTYLGGKIYGIEEFDSLSVRNIQLFNSLLQMLQENKVEVSFFIVPYHPIAFAKISEEYKNVNATERKILEIAKKQNIKVSGSFNPSKNNLDESNFYDAMHCKESGIELLLQL